MHEGKDFWNEVYEFCNAYAQNAFSLASDAPLLTMTGTNYQGELSPERGQLLVQLQSPNPRPPVTGQPR